MSCDIQALLTNGRCLAHLPAVGVALWCNAAEAIAGATTTPVALLSDDGNWYQLRVVNGELRIGPVTATPGDNDYLVLVDLTDGLKYTFTLYGTGLNVEWEIDGPSVEAETPTTLYAGATPYTLSTVNSGETIELNAV